MDKDLEKNLKFAHVKRFLELWSSDIDFEQKFGGDISAVLEAYDLDLDPEEIRRFYNCREGAAGKSSFFELYKRVKQKEAEDFKKGRQDCQVPDLRFRTWRDRQIARTRIQFGGENNNFIIHSPVCFELSKGCSVGCWYCGLSAQKLSGIYPYTKENAASWKEILHIIRGFLGPFSKFAFYYWATEPMDNPDYEKFCMDSYDILGLFPCTTTAAALKNPGRIRKLIEMSEKRGCMKNRFSVSSLDNLEKHYREFSAEELINTDLVIHDDTNGCIKSNSGRFYKAARNNPEIRIREEKKLFMNLKKMKKISSSVDNSYSFLPSSITCVSGFLLNMVDKSIKLISPCPASDEWPLGYIVYDEGSFSSPRDMQNIMESLAEKNMNTKVGKDDILKFLPDLKYETVPGGFRVYSDHAGLKLSDPGYESYYRYIGDTLMKGGKNMEEISFMSLFQMGISFEKTVSTINELFFKGVLMESAQMN